MPNIPTGGAEMPRATMDTMVPRLEPVVRAPPLISENKASPQAEKTKVDEKNEQAKRQTKEDRRKEDRRKKKEAVLVDNRLGADRREHVSLSEQIIEEPNPQDKSNSRLGRYINVKV